MATSAQTSNPVDAITTETADSAFEFPTSENHPSTQKPESSANDNTGRNGAGGAGKTSSQEWTENARLKASAAKDALKTKYRVASETTDDFVHDSPWKAITLAALFGFIVGTLTSR
jgi:ElaB/YqjD/DUF883 family membrane-anchored ribosome-binding protein